MKYKVYFLIVNKNCIIIMSSIILVKLPSKMNTTGSIMLHKCFTLQIIAWIPSIAFVLIIVACQNLIREEISLCRKLGGMGSRSICSFAVEFIVVNSSFASSTSELK